MSQSSAIQLENVSKIFGRRRKRVEAVRQLSLDVSAGQVFGFLGPNGAGKSTTIRMMMDLIRPSAGSVLLFGQPVQNNLPLLRRVGALVEGATFYDFLTGRKNLEVLARSGGCYDEARIQTLLEQVGMAGRADRRVQGYSTGMKQRLGLAAALLNDPDLVILDEPTNGLDPAGIQDVRHFIRNLAEKQGKTVFLSSHLLSEVEQVCDQVGIISNGRLVQTGNVAELLSSQAVIRLEVMPADRALGLLLPKWPTKENGRWLEVQAPREAGPEIVQQLVAAEVQIFQMVVQQQSLEDLFLAATADSPGEDSENA
ncbi:MAG: ABC transporter ATP-binding protein [Ardenticatenaceae bacterium]|nr:ABC transporter ATP-binding protein [Ardenticatenaceae bacterium]MCB8946843.1 ABC transporter ATP-binding protein [Ardenticatenaceae bacterium]